MCGLFLVVSFPFWKDEEGEALVVHCPGSLVNFI